MTLDEEIKEKHQKMLYTVVRVRAKEAGGSGTIIYSESDPREEDAFETFVLTNHHVIEKNIEQGKEWNPLLQKDEKRDVFSLVMVEPFNYKYVSECIGTKGGVQADIVAYNRRMDLALLRLRDIEKYRYVAKMLAKNKIRELKRFVRTYAVGATLGHPPLATPGEITGLEDEIDNYIYFCQSAPTSFGNSGGATFRADTMEFIGIPSRISVIGWGSPIDFMSYFIPMPTIYKFFDMNYYQFLYDKKYDSVKCEQLREEAREEAKHEKETRALKEEED